MPLSLSQAIGTGFGFRVYGQLIEGMDANGLPVSFASVGGPDRAGLPVGAAFAHIRAFSLGEFCRRLPSPIMMVVPDQGEAVEEGDPCGRIGETVWSLLPTDRSIVLMPISGTIGDLLEDPRIQSIDGNIEFSNPRLENGRACVDVRIWCRVEILGARWGFDERIPVCIPLEGCHTLWEIGVANLQICFRAPNQLCAKLCVGKWGLSKCWDACVALPLSAHQEASTSHPCRCHQAA